MVLYQCERCGYSTKMRSSFKYHLNRKFICKPKMSKVSIDTLKELYGFKIDDDSILNQSIENFVNTNVNTNVNNVNNLTAKLGSSIIPSVNTNVNTKLCENEICVYKHRKNSEKCLQTHNFFQCKKCSKVLSCRQSLWRHKKYYCKSELQKIDKDIDMAMCGDTYKNHIVNANNAEYVQANNIQTQNNNNIVINNYGCENKNYVTLKKVKQLIEANYKTAIQELVKYTHFNKDYPENHNIAITNIKSKYGYIYNDGMYEIKIVNKLLEELLERNRRILEDTYDNKHVKKKMNNKHMNEMFERWLDKMIDNETLQKIVLDDLYTTIVNLTKKFKINVNQND